MIYFMKGQSGLHKLPASVKFISLTIISLFLFFIPNVMMALLALFLVFGLYFMAGFHLFDILKQFRLMLWFLIALFFFQYFSTTFYDALLVVVRLATLYLLASLVTLTTTFSEIMEFFEKIFSFSRFFKLNPAKISLALALALRFIPLLQAVVQEVREAQIARGLEGNFFALIMPVLIRCLKMQEDIANAIDARCYDARCSD